MQFDESHRDVLNEILRWRRDVRHFKTEPVPAAEPVAEPIPAVEAAPEAAPAVE